MITNETLDKCDSLIEVVLNNWKLPPGPDNKRLGKKIDIRKWLKNFDPPEVDDMLLLLKKIHYVTDDNMKSTWETLSDVLKRIFNEDLSGVKFFALGNSPSSSGTNFLYNLRLNLGVKESFTPSEHFSKINLTNVKAFVFIDDFIGSGEQAIGFARNELSKITIDKYYFVAFAFEDGLENVKKNAGFKDVIVGPGNILSNQYKAFSPQSVYFEIPEERKRLEKICEYYGKMLYPKYPLGHGNLQSLLVFPDNVPNNTLPIIWAGPESESKEGKPWNPVWKRKNRENQQKNPSGKKKVNIANLNPSRKLKSKRKNWLIFKKTIAIIGAMGGVATIISGILISRSNISKESTIPVPIEQTNQQDSISFKHDFWCLTNGKKKRISMENDLIYSGDHMRLSLEPKEDGYFYIYLIDSKGQISFLFPPTSNRNNSAINKNPVKANTHIDLPSSGAAYNFDNTKGNETFFIISSKKELGNFESLNDRYSNKGNSDVSKSNSLPDMPAQYNLELVRKELDDVIERLQEECPSCIIIEEFIHVGNQRP